ncbi:hypothetical protein C8N46_103468 [Kordia periserrulae]|uniref:Uncharacterized protein n=1 Tax=Kordia periserrulae TaxID=701523 RepID=A0A2T6C246_9FLAO|nr:hypothetical protein [Kordia periserrulae]PTX62368.1 hypothetical protein C8N46_103468 [Kordia periserrulae]
MKKKNLKSLRLQKSKVSHLNQHVVSGGDIIIIIPSYRRICPEPQQTVTTCSGAAECDSMQICTANICKTNELDTNTLPIC